MSIRTLFAPTTNPTESGVFGFPPNVNSPAPERVRITQLAPDGVTEITNDYDGAQLAPRSMVVVMTTLPGEQMPPDARLVVNAIGTGNAETTVAVLTAEKPFAVLDAPFNALIVRKPGSTGTPLGADLHGANGSTNTTTS